MSQITPYQSPFQGVARPRNPGLYSDYQPYNQYPQPVQPVQPVQVSSSDQTLSIEALISLLQTLPAVTQAGTAYQALVTALQGVADGQPVTAGQLRPVATAMTAVNAAQRQQLVLSMLPLFGGFGGDAGGGSFLSLILIMKLINPSSTGGLF